MKKNHPVRLPKWSLGSTWLLLAAAVYLSWPMNMSLWRYLAAHLEIHGLVMVLFAASYPLLILAVVWLLLALVALPYMTKPLLSVLILISCVANYWMVHYRIYIDSDMIRNVFETNNREAMDLVTLKLVFWVLITGILPVVLLWMTRIRYQSQLKEIRNRFLTVALCAAVIGIIAVVFYKNHASFGRNHHRMIRLVSPTNYINGTIKYFSKEALAKRQFEILDKKARLAPFADPYPTVFILIVGETARAANFSLNGYPQPTNPRLEKERLLNFPSVYSCGTATAISVPCMFSSKPRTEFDAGDAKMTQNLLDLLASAGYDILWRENDDGCKGVCARVKTDYFDPNRYKQFCDGKSCFDEVMLDDLDDYLRTVTKDTFIVLHTIGSHGPTYYQRYPAAFRKFTPTCDSADLQSCTQEEIRNTYDNTVLYTDHVIAESIRILKQFPYFESGLMYVSDHGESLGENNIYLHGMPYAIAPQEQKKVPMVLWMSDNMVKYDHLDYVCLQKEAAKNTYSHDNIFHSMLGLMEVNSKLYAPKMDLFDKCRKKPLPTCDEDGVKCKPVIE
ncbi:phosphoethanolamine--lipid A transferase [Oxalobacter vibrioformis]|uniref:Phosphoethanolamine--lipid A transferase n=1 Tax=Oxalobacter vibrioformis TaxID=933080 RepID=A0A9E9LYQ2_9BURK|nr:phosphoethanolamine--lipid A transferase [Oxalobacter vibrioformis]WAW10090.1 phosphoethanolamine--lipid A transferase [Oxalobacter vibrioformis]